MFEAAGYAGGHTNTIRVDTRTRPTTSTPASSCSTTATTRTSSGCWPGSASPWQPSTMSFSVSDGHGDFEYSGASPQRAVRQAPAPAHAVVSPHGLRPGCASTAGPGAAASDGDDAVHRCGDWLERAALLAAVRRSADRPAGLGRVVRRPRRRCGASRRGSWPSSSTTTACSGSAAGRSGGSSAGVGAVRRGADRAVRRADAAADAGRAVAPRRSGVLVCAARRRRRALRRGRAGHSLRPGARAARGRHRARARGARRRSRTRPTRRSSTPTAGCCPAAAGPGRAGTTTGSPSPTGRATVTYHMNRLQSLRADREFCVTLNRTEAIDPDRVIRRITYAHPVFTADGRGGAGALRGDQRPRPRPLLRRLLGLGLPRGRRPQRTARGRAIRERGCEHCVAASTRGPSATARARAAARSFQHRIALFYLDLDELPAARRRAAGGRARPGPLRFRRARLPRRDSASRSAMPSATRYSARTGRPAGGADPPAHATARRSATASTRSASTTASTPHGERVHAVVAEVTNTPWGERHAYVLDRAGRDGRRASNGGRVRQGAARLAVHGDGSALPLSAPACPGPAARPHREP